MRMLLPAVAVGRWNLPSAVWDVKSCAVRVLPDRTASAQLRPRRLVRMRGPFGESRLVAVGRRAGARRPVAAVAVLLVLLEERLGLQHQADELIEADLHQPHLDGVPAPIDRGAHPAGAVPLQPVRPSPPREPGARRPCRRTHRPRTRSSPRRRTVEPASATPPLVTPPLVRCLPPCRPCPR